MTRSVRQLLRNYQSGIGNAEKGKQKTRPDPFYLVQVRKAVNQGMALGNDRFKQEIEQLSGRRVTTLRRGPKSKSK